MTEDKKCAEQSKSAGERLHASDADKQDVNRVSDEPTAAEHGCSIVAGAAAASLSYGLCRLFVPSERAEDIVDMVHSLGTSGIAIYGVSVMKPHPLHIRRLPAHLASGSGPIVRMFTCSMGYFCADFALIVIDVLFRGKFPRLWGGRIVHHIVQITANSYCAFGKQQRADVMLANRSVLCTAYMAELSSVLLRLSNLVRQGPVGTRRAINWLLVVTFFFSRIVNFPYAMAMYRNCHTIAPPNMYRSFLVATTAGYALSLGWFFKIVKIAQKTGTDSRMLPSIEY